MGFPKLDALLSTHNRVGLDTVVFIYHLEGVLAYAELTTRLLTAVAQGQVEAVASVLVLTELVVKPLKLGEEGKAQACSAFLRGLPRLSLVPIDEEAAWEAARLRAQYHLRTPDALHLAAARITGATAFITNDEALRRVQPTGIKIVILKDLLNPR